MNAIFESGEASDKLVSSHIVTVEMESASARGLRGRVLDKQAQGTMLLSLAIDLGTVVTVPVSSSLINNAARVAARHALRALDAIHLASAIEASIAIEEPFIFVSSDKELLQAAMDAGFVTLNPEDAQALQQLQSLRQDRNE